MKTNELRYNQIQSLLQYQERCLLLHEKPYIDGIFGFKIVKKGKKKRKYDVILTEINDSYKCESLKIPLIFNKISNDMDLQDNYNSIDFGNIESLPNSLCLALYYLKEVKGHKVYNIGHSCFFSCKNLRQIDFPLLNSVHHHAFFATNIEIFSQPKVSYIEDEILASNFKLKLLEVNKLDTANENSLQLNSLEFFRINTLILNNFSMFVGCNKRMNIIINNVYIKNNLYFDVFKYESEQILDEALEIFKYNLSKLSHLSESEKTILYKYSSKEIEFIRTIYHVVHSNKLNDFQLNNIKNNCWMYDISNIGLCLYNNYEFKRLRDAKSKIDIKFRYAKQIKRLKLMGLKKEKINTYLQLQSKYLIGD